MDFINFKTSILCWVRKYKYAWIVLLAGILLMLLPEGSNEPEIIQKEKQQEQLPIQSLETQLEDTLSCLKGVGEVKVMLSVARGEQIIYQTDSTYSQKENTTDTRTQTILVSDSDRNEGGLIHQINPPVYLGAIVLAQGADNPVAKLAIVEAVSNVTGLGADKISVLTMG